MEVKDVAVVLFFSSLASHLTFAQGLDPFEQDPLIDGIVSIEAEHYHALVAGSGSVSNHLWQSHTNPSLSGEEGMQVLPNVGAILHTGYNLECPRMDYYIEFNRTGTHYIAVRGIGLSGNDDSCHVGLNGMEVSTGQRVDFFSSSVGWSVDTQSNGRVRVEVPTIGVHVLNVWMREDGFILDKIVLTTNESYVPSGDGPPESTQGSGTGLEEEHPQSTEIVSLTRTNGMIVATFAPVPAVDQYQLMREDEIGGPMTPESSAVVDGFQIMLVPTNDFQQFYGIDAVLISTNRELTSIVLNRVAYGPTPDLIERVHSGPSAMGAEAYIQEQLAPNLLIERADFDPVQMALRRSLDNHSGDLDELAAWHAYRAVTSDRQLLEVMLQFINNHFVTYYWKTRSWFRNEQGQSSSDSQRTAAYLEYQEMERWREILLDPKGTFYDLLRVSIESPSMIIYLDTVENDKAEPNENYSREIMELFSMGVDNGYDQSDIEAMSPAWTGWRVGKVHPNDVYNPHAAAFSNDFVYLQDGDSSWHVRKGTSEPASDWRELSYVETTNWFIGQTGIGFGDGDDNTVLTDMQHNYSSIYLRHEFTIPNPTNVPLLKLRLYADDGCIAWINGQEVVRFNAAGNKTYDGIADSSREASWQEFFIQNPGAFLQAGDNVLAIHALNRSISDGDFSIDAALVLPGIWSFVFDPSSHDESEKTIFAGKTVDARFGPPLAGTSYELTLPARSGASGVQDGYDIIEHLVGLPYVQEFISVKLCTLFVHENFHVGSHYNVSQLSQEAELIKACMAAWSTPASDGRTGNIRSVLNTIFTSELFRSQAASHQKVKTPFEFVVSAVRALRTDMGVGQFSAATDGYDFREAMDRMGMELFARAEPDGWPEVGQKWIDTGTITERIRFVQNFLMDPNDSLKDVDYGSSEDDNVVYPVTLLQVSAPGALDDPDVVIDFFFHLIFPGEGSANLELMREECRLLLNSDETGVPDSSPFHLLTVGSLDYDRRVRALVGVLLSSPQFNEQ